MLKPHLEQFQLVFSQSKKLENKLKLTKQMDEIRKQKQELHRISKVWRVAHGMSQLVHDTDVIVNKNLR